MDRKESTAIILLALAVTLPFLNKPIHIDDTFVIHVARSVLADALDPFAGTIDWAGHETLVWQRTTNPPFLSYYLAPFGALFGFSESVLHIAMIPFFLLFLVGMRLLAHRFNKGDWLPVLFLASSAAFIVSGNVMRDIPAGALVTAGMAFFVLGVDRMSQRWLFWAGLLVGLAILTKYSAATVIPALAAYSLLRRQFRSLVWLLVPIAMLLGWCLHGWILYGQAHPVFLLLKGHAGAGIAWQDKLFCGLAALGSLIYLAPALLWRSIVRAQWTRLAGTALILGISAVAALVFYETADGEFLFWLALGLILLIDSLRMSCRTGSDLADNCFLLLWLLCPFVFSFTIVPFQAVRHLIPMLPPLLILLFRYFEGNRTPGWIVVKVCFVAQLLISLMVQLADYEYAATYRDFASHEKREMGSKKVWYVGHWGWKFYADQNGFRMLHREGPYPEPGDVLLWPERVHIGDVFGSNRSLRDGLRLIDSRVYQAVWPIRTMSASAGAGFYALIRRRLPYRFWLAEPLETGRAYRVGPDISDR